MMRNEAVFLQVVDIVNNYSDCNQGVDVRIAPELRPASAAPSAGFTMIEIIVAITVILILAGILLVGLRSIAGSSQAGETRVLLENVRGMLDELDSKARLGARNRPLEWWVGPAGSPSVVQAQTQPEQVDFWHRTTDQDSIDPPRPRPIEAPGSVKPGANDRTKHPAVRNTAIAMAKLVSVPANRTKLDGIPAQRLLRLEDVAPNASDPVPATSLINEATLPPVVLDAWGNPIIFVPASGMIVTLNSIGGQRLITSSKVRQIPPTEYAAETDRPFFASAGPDGDFSSGDDNLYSFEQ